MTYYKSYRIIDGKPRWVIVDENRKIINRIPSKEVITTKTISIYKNPSYGGWYEQYRVTNKEEIKIANKIWKDITKLR